MWFPFRRKDGRHPVLSTQLTVYTGFPGLRSRPSTGFTLVEALAAISLAGLGISVTLGALTRLNSFASSNRNATGAYALAMNQIDAIQSAGPFRPADKPPQVPPVLSIGTTTNKNVVIYGDSQSGTTNVPGIMETTIADVSSGKVNMYRATVTVSWQSQGGGPIWSGPPRNRREYQVKLNTLRASDE